MYKIIQIYWESQKVWHNLTYYANSNHIHIDHIQKKVAECRTALHCMQSCLVLILGLVIGSVQWRAGQIVRLICESIFQC